MSRTEQAAARRSASLRRQNQRRLLRRSTCDREQRVDDPAVAAGDEQTFGPWVVAATNDGAGSFVNCTAYGMHGDDQLILSYFPDDAWTFGLYRAAWNLDTNQTYYLWYNVDGPADAEGVIKRPVEAAEPTRIFFEVSDLEDIIERMESGRTLNLQFRGLTGDAEISAIRSTRRRRPSPPQGNA